MYAKSYTLTMEQQADVDKTLAEYKEKTKDFAHVFCERVPTEEELQQCEYYDGLED